jgi:hypothetical protein
MKKVKLLIGALAIFAMTSCSITIPVSATSNPIGTKIGKSTGTGFFEVLNFGVDASISSAAHNGGITKVSTVDFQKQDVLGIVQIYTCIITGE